MSEPTDDEYRDWKDLLASPGWARLVAHRNEVLSSEGIEKLVEKVLNKDDDTTLTMLREIAAGKRWVQAMFAHPYSRLAMLRGSVEGEPYAHMGRRGAL